MRISARADYALRACIELARAGDLGSTSDAMAEAQRIPQSFLQNILGDMRRAGYVRSNGCRGGGYGLAMPADQVSVARVLRAMDGPLLRVHGMDPDELRYPESAQALAALWIAVRGNVAGLLEQVSLRDMAAGELPPPVSSPRSEAAEAGATVTPPASPRGRGGLTRGHG